MSTVGLAHELDGNHGHRGAERLSGRFERSPQRADHNELDWDAVHADVVAQSVGLLLAHVVEPARTSRREREPQQDNGVICRDIRDHQKPADCGIEQLSSSGAGEGLGRVPRAMTPGGTTRDSARSGGEGALERLWTRGGCKR